MKMQNGESLLVFCPVIMAYLPPIYLGILTATSNVFALFSDDAFVMKVPYTQDLKAHLLTVMRKRVMDFAWMSLWPQVVSLRRI